MRKSHVMLIDDNQIDNFVTSHVIKKSGLTDKISSMKSAIEALDYLENLNGNVDDFPDLIFLDISMPEMDGFEFLDKVINFERVRENYCDIIMLTSSNNERDIQRAGQYSIVKEYFVKPLKIDLLHGLMEK